MNYVDKRAVQESFADALCQSIVNPFPNKTTARVFLSKLDNLTISNLEYERAIFCIQIAFYFVTCLAIIDRISNPSSKKELIDNVHSRIRCWLAEQNSRVEFSDFIVSPSEWSQFEADTRVDTFRLTTTRLTLFDSVGSRRFKEYYDAMSEPNLFKFYAVAACFLFHYSARKYKSGEILAIATWLSNRYDTVSEFINTTWNARWSEVAEARS
jgi:hypothetical protein